jgi:hypothetical protein
MDVGIKHGPSDVHDVQCKKVRSENVPIYNQAQSCLSKSKAISYTIHVSEEMMQVQQKLLDLKIELMCHIYNDPYESDESVSSLTSLLDLGDSLNIYHKPEQISDPFGIPNPTESPEPLQI